MALAAPSVCSKRALDLLVSMTSLVLAAPIILIAVAVIRLDSRGPAFYHQKRIGREGRVFTCVKLRTMQMNTGDKPSHEINASAVTRVGHFLRRTKLDELPQLWNVVLGDMSLVGPRPCLPTQKALIEARREKGVLVHRPGITGLAQVAGIDMSDPVKLACIDAGYQPSFWTDISLIFATLSGAGQGDRVVK